jgi:hypothetical protein
MVPVEETVLSCYFFEMLTADAKPPLSSTIRPLTKGGGGGDGEIISGDAMYSI